MTTAKPTTRRLLDRETYAQMRAQGFTQFDSLKAAGSRITSKNSAGKIASTLERDPVVQATIERTKAQLREKTIEDHEELRAFLVAELQTMIRTSSQWPAKCRAVEILCRMKGFNAPDKHEVTTPDTLEQLLQTLREEEPTNGRAR